MSDMLSTLQEIYLECKWVKTLIDNLPSQARPGHESTALWRIYDKVMAGLTVEERYDADQEAFERARRIMGEE